MKSLKRMMFRDFTPDEIARFTFIEEQHPADFVLYRGAFRGQPVSVMVWVDNDNQALRPFAIILNDENMPDLQLEGVSIVMGDEKEPEDEEDY